MSNVASFDPQPQEQPLNQKALNDLDNLQRYGLRSQATTTGQGSALDATLNKAAELLNQVVSEVNDRAWEERIRRQNRQQRSQKDDDQDPDNNAQDKEQEYQDLQNKVRDLNIKLDENMRRVVDDQTWVGEMLNSVKHVATKSKDAKSRQIQHNRSSGHNDDDNDDVEASDNRQTDFRPDSSEHATALLHAAQSTKATEWNAKSLTQKYSQNPTYVDFYKVRFDAQNQEENPPPVPHHSMWFAMQEGRTANRALAGTQRSTQGSNDDDEEEEDSIMQDVGDDTELQVSSENISCKCPLTLQWFVEPMTSTKCPHSFEKEAILSLIRSSQERTPLTTEEEAELDERHPRGARGRLQAEVAMKAKHPKCARCPETGCRTMLTENDIRFDIALQRRTKRAQEAEQRAMQEEDFDDDEDSDDALPQTQRRRRSIVAIGSSPAGRRRTFVKPEREISVIPNSQSQSQLPTNSQMSNTRRRGGFMDIDNEDEDEDIDG